jgi:hypothetical protein
MDPAREAEQREGLNLMIVPGVRSSSGFVSGCWTLDRTVGESVVLITFESIGDAEAFAANVEANARHQAAVGIELISIRIVEVSAFAE